MKECAYVDPLEAAEELCRCILPAGGRLGDIAQLAQSLDKFLYGLRWLMRDEVPPIQETDREPPNHDRNALHAKIGRRYPDLGLYWTALYTDCRQEGQVTTGDAINDMTDILVELRKALWFGNTSRDDAMGALQFAYRHHLYHHMLPLRRTLDEMMFDG